MKAKNNPFLRAALLIAAAVAALGLVDSAQATTYTWDGTNNAPWSDAKWSDGTNSAINWVNGGGNDAVVNSGDVWSPISITANSLTIGDGVGGANNASARIATDNAFQNITSITLNSDGYLGGSAGASSHLGLINLNGGTIGGTDAVGAAATWGIFNFDNTVHVTANSTISVTGGGATLGQSGGTQFNVDSGTTLSVTGTLVHRAGADNGLIKTGAGTMVLSNTNTYTGGTTVNGGTLELAGGGDTGVIRGTININNPGTTVKLNASDALGYGGSGWVTQVNINDGTLDNAVAGNNAFKTNFTLTGGTISSTGGGKIHFTTGYGISTLASSNASTVSSGIELRDSNMMPISVANGAAATDLLISGAIVGGGGGINKTGDGTLTLSNTNTYTGATTVSTGTLKVSGSIGTSDVTVNGGILASGSSGTVGKNVTVNSGAKFAAGDVAAVGAATVANDLNFSSGSIFDWDLTTGAGNGTYDTVSVTGALNITNGAKFNIVSSTEFSDNFWDASHTWSNIFGGKTIDDFLVSNFLYSGSATAPAAEGSFSVSGSSLTWTAVPEPTSALAGLLITAGLLRRRRV